MAGHLDVAQVLDRKRCPPLALNAPKGENQNAQSI
jgi:hypothetical protein